MISCNFEDGGSAKLRHAVVNAIIIKANKILLAKRSEKIREGGKWCLIGGFMNRDETIQEALVREVQEESGYEIKNLILFTVVDVPERKGSDWQNINFVFVCEPGEKTGKSDWESTEQKWFDLDNLPHEDEIAFDHYDIIRLYLNNPNFNPLNPLKY